MLLNDAVSLGCSGLTTFVGGVMLLNDVISLGWSGSKFYPWRCVQVLEQLIPLVGWVLRGPFDSLDTNGDLTTPPGQSADRYAAVSSFLPLGTHDVTICRFAADRKTSSCVESLLSFKTGA